MNQDDSTTRIAICIVTRQRPKGLARTLESLNGIQVPHGYQAEVFVIDNDDPDAARNPIQTVLGNPVHRIPEPTPGIPFARNRALEVVQGRADFLAFIDDDETVDPKWLQELLKVQQDSDAPIVTGPALPRLPDNAPQWASRSGVYNCHRYTTGSIRPWAFTHNVLASTSLFTDGQHRFDERMRFSGGSDTQLFRELKEAGHSIVWADEAVAWEWYPESRISYRWIFARSYRIGLTDTWMEMSRRSRARIAGRTCWVALRYAARGGVRFLRNILHPPTALAAGGWDFMRSAGLIASLLGFHYDEYRTIHGE